MKIIEMYYRPAASSGFERERERTMEAGVEVEVGTGVNKERVVLRQQARGDIPMDFLFRELRRATETALGNKLFGKTGA